MKSAQDMNQKRLRRQRAHVKLVKQPRTLPAHQLKEQLRTRSAFAYASKRLRFKDQAVPKRAARVTKDILTRQKAAYEKLLRVQVAEHKKRLHEYGKRVAQQREKAKLWLTWWNALTVDHRRLILRQNQAKGQTRGMSFWCPGLHGQGLLVGAL